MDALILARLESVRGYRIAGAVQNVKRHELGRRDVHLQLEFCVSGALVHSRVLASGGCLRPLGQERSAELDVAAGYLRQLIGIDRGIRGRDRQRQRHRGEKQPCGSGHDWKPPDFLECARSLRREHNEKATACYLAVQHLCPMNPDVSSTITTGKDSRRYLRRAMRPEAYPLGFKAAFVIHRLRGMAYVTHVFGYSFSLMHIV